MVDGEHGGSHEPGQTEDGTDDNENSDDQKIEVVAAALLQMGKTAILSATFLFVACD